MPTSPEVVWVDPRFRIPYYTYVLQGFGLTGHTARYRRLDAPHLGSASVPWVGLAARVGDRRIWVDTEDRADVDERAYEWCDVYGKVNVTEDDAAVHPKIRPLGPLFGVTLWPLPSGYAQVRHMVRPGTGLRAAIAGLRFQAITRLPVDRYVPGPSDPGFVFHRSRAWADRHVGANAPRERFIEALGSMSVGHDASLVDDRIPLSEYLDHTRRSALVFNSPAVHGCLGWKLGEYLALGKAIVTTAFDRALPSPLVHGQHVHLVPDEVAAMREAIELLTTDHDYRTHLEVNARAWFDAHMSPARVASTLLVD